MRQTGFAALLAALSATSALAPTPALADPAPPGTPVAGSPPRADPLSGAAGAISERVQIVYDTVSGDISRRLVRVIDPAPTERLDFSWEPAPGNSPGLDAEGFATGQGVLTWRIPGTPSYDLRAMAARYDGELVRGAPEGKGRLVLRDGSWRDGSWRAGLLEGAGRWRTPDGSLYEGSFAAGVPEGEGILRAAAGWIWTGGFKAGLPEGPGLLRPAGGEPRAALMAAGQEIQTDMGPDSAELLPAQGGEAGKLEIAVISNARVSLMQDLSYAHFNDGQTIHLVPQLQYGDGEELLDIWNGTGLFEEAHSFDFFTKSDWEATRAFVDVMLATKDGSRVRVDALELVLDSSVPHLRPMLTTKPAPVCVGHRPWFEIINRGWGAVEAPRLRVGFAPYDEETFELPTEPQTRWVDVPVAPFDTGISLHVGEALRALGVDVDTLAGNRFTCPSLQEMERCAANLLASVAMGELTGQITGETVISSVLVGELSYTWTNGWGGQITSVERFGQMIALAQIEVAGISAEFGDGGAFSTPAPEFQEVLLPYSSAGGRVPIELRGNPNISNTTAYVQLHSERSSIHTMHIEARLGDGSVQSSMPVMLYYLLPRMPSHVSSIRPEACFLHPDL